MIKDNWIAQLGHPDILFPSGCELYLLNVEQAKLAICDDTATPFFDIVSLHEIKLRLGFFRTSRKYSKMVKGIN